MRRLRRAVARICLPVHLAPWAVLLWTACGRPADAPPAATPPSDQRELIWTDEAGTPQGALGIRGAIRRARLSADGSRVAWLDTDGRVWTRAVGGGPPVAVNAGGARGLAWRHDGGQMALDAPTPSSRVFIHDFSPDIAEQTLDITGLELTVDDWSADGQFLAYQQNGGPKQTDVWLLFLEDPGTPLPLASSNGPDGPSAFSPDSQSVAYVSDREGRAEVFLRPFPAPGVTIRVSEAGGRWPHWKADGRTLLYQAPDGTVIAATVSPVPNLAVTDHRRLGRLAGELQGVTPDGLRLLALAPVP